MLEFVRVEYFTCQAEVVEAQHQFSNPSDLWTLHNTLFIFSDFTCKVLWVMVKPKRLAECQFFLLLVSKDFSQTLLLHHTRVILPVVITLPL